MVGTKILRNAKQGSGPAQGPMDSVIALPAATPAFDSTTDFPELGSHGSTTRGAIQKVTQGRLEQKVETEQGIVQVAGPPRCSIRHPVLSVQAVLCISTITYRRRTWRTMMNLGRFWTIHGDQNWPD
jgi:hypothetical protein